MGSRCLRRIGMVPSIGVILVVFMGLFGLSGCDTAQTKSSGTQSKAERVFDGYQGMGAPFVDNMVLQRGMPVPVWGWTDPGASVTVEFAGKKASTVAGEDGKWMVKLPSLKASFEPRVMTVKQGDQVKEIKNILVGEVWMASGQSNMQWTATKSTTAKLVNKFKAEQEAVGSKVAPIREFQIKSVYSMLHPISKSTGVWDDGNYISYSAIAFSFAHKIHKELNVPVGILNCSFSQTPIEAWVPRVGYRDATDDYAKNIYKKVLETDPYSDEHMVAWDAFYADIEKQIKENRALIASGKEAMPIKPSPPGNMNGNRDATWLYHGRLHGVVPFAIRGAIWNQGYANMGKGYSYYSNLHSLVRGWRLVWDKPELPVYFHQFYSAAMRHPGKENNNPTIGGAADMRIATWMARDIPNTGMASQIDIYGGIHYSAKTVPGQRLALHALKNQYGKKDLVVDGPMYKGYSVKGSELIVEFENAAGGLVVAETKSNLTNREVGYAIPKLLENGESKIKLFYIAGEDKVWHPANVKIQGSKVVLTSPGVKAPKGVSYAQAGVGGQPNLYNKAMLPATPFIFYDNKMVTKETWSEEKLQVAGVVIDPNSIGKLNEYRKMPILSTQFRDKAVLQAGKPVKIWGSAIHDWGYEAKGEAVIHFSFGNIKKKIPVKPGMKEWSVTLPPMKAGNKEYTLNAKLTIDGELAHERTAKGIVFGDVWYVGAAGMEKSGWKLPKAKDSGQIVRMIGRQAKRYRHTRPSRYSVAVSTTPAPNNRFASFWKDATGLAEVLGHQIAAKKKTPVGIIFMDAVVNKGSKNPALKSWIAPKNLNQHESLMEDYRIIGSQIPSNPYYLDNMERYLDAWKTYWGEFIPTMIATESVPDGATWGSYPTTLPKSKSSATQTHNVLVESFDSTALSGIMFLSADTMGEEGQAELFGPQMTVLANSLKSHFGGKDVPFIYTQPSVKLAPGITKPKGIKGVSKAVEIDDWKDASKAIEAAVSK